MKKQMAPAGAQGRALASAESALKDLEPHGGPESALRGPREAREILRAGSAGQDRGDGVRSDFRPG